MSSVGVLAVQGDVREHAAVLASLGCDVVKVRRPAEVEAVDALVIPGGESSVQDKLVRAFGLREPLERRLADGMPVLGSCAGMIMLARDLVDGIDGQETLGAIPMTVRRNAFGRQVDSSEMTIDWIDGGPMHATFIRAPWVEAWDSTVEVLASVHADGAEHPVAVRFGNAIATSFHPEISGDSRVHALLTEAIG